MNENFRQLIAPNYSARTKFFDFVAYFAGFFLLSLPFLPFPAIRFYFAIFTFVFYFGTISVLVSFDLLEFAKDLWQKVKSIQIAGSKVAEGLT